MDAAGNGTECETLDQSVPELCVSSWEVASRHPWSALFRSTQRSAVIKMIILHYWAVSDLCVKMCLLIDQFSVNDNHQQGTGVTLRGHQSRTRFTHARSSTLQSTHYLEETRV